MACHSRRLPEFRGVLCTTFVVGVLAALAVGLAGAAASFPMPGANGWTVWQAEQAEREGGWQISEPTGAGARYVQPSAAGGALVFPFESDRPAMLRVRPVWWPTGEQKMARRFPYPLVRQPGPDAVDYVGTTVFATAPAAGRVIAIDAVTEKVLGVIEVGGYLSDLVADRERGRVYVADALGDRLVAIQASSRTVLGEFPVSGSPWALALHGEVGYVALRDSRRLVGYDLDSARVVAQFDLPSAPINLELVGSPPRQLVVRFQEQTLDALSLEPAPADRQQFEGQDWSGKPPPGCGGPDCRCNWYEVAGPHQLTHGGSTGERKVVDVSEITKGRADPEIVRRFGDHPGPASPVLLKVGDPGAYFLFFTSPSRGVIGVLDEQSKPIGSIEVGGYLADLVPADGKLYAADAAGDRVVVVDAKTRKIEGEISVPGGPFRIAVVREVGWQRPELVPPTQVNRLYVTCVESKDLAAIDLTSRKVVRRAAVSGPPRAVTFVSMPDPGWWPVMADDRIAPSLQPRVAVEIRPVSLDLATLQVAPAALDTPRLASSHDRVAVAVPGAQAPKRFAARNELALVVDDQRFLDLSAVADPQRLPARALSAKEAPGSITVSLDGGPEHNWAAGTWVGPDSELFLVNDSESFWRYNAASLRVGPGRHVLRVKANSSFARLDAVAVRRSLEPDLEVALLPEPQQVHGRVPLASYQGVFYDKEPVQFTMRIANRREAPVRATVSFALANYLGETSQPIPPASFSLDARGGRSVPITLNPKEMGRFTLTVTTDTPDGRLVREVRFLRLPKLEHPRMFFRKEDIPAIRARIAQRPNLFRRYGDWLERMSQQEGRFPQRFLPPGMTADDCAKAAPAEIKSPDVARDLCGWRNYELGWRVLASELALAFLKPESAILKAKVEALRAAEKVDSYCQFHHHGPFFPGVDASLLDLAADPAKEAPKILEQMTKSIGNMNVLPWTLVTLEEPLTPQKRALIYEIMTLENNAEQYFDTHRGRRAGAWWQNPYTWCHCQMHGYALMFMFLHNIFGEPRLFEKPVFASLLTFLRYADPYRDARGIQPNLRGPNGEPWHWIFASLTRHPLEKSTYQWEEWIEKMSGPLPGDEKAAVDKLMALEGIALKGEMTGAANYFVSAVSVPMALALGWYEPRAPEVKWEETPPTALFEVEGWAAMRSGFDAKATEVSFVSGVRDHTTRHKPNHFTILKAGQYLIGTPSLYTDDGNNTGAWGNTIVIGDKWREQWALNLQHPRDGEHLVINRFPPATFTYLSRDKLAFGYQAAESGWGGGLDLHGHTETLFMREGRLLGYQTWPQLDYVAGDASNAWPVDEVSQVDRQMVFLKPDLVVVYDRVKLGPAGKSSRWVAATGPEVRVSGDTFVIKSGSEFLTGRALLPPNPALATPKPPEPGWLWKDQKLLEISPAQQGDQVEYLVVMRVGGGDAPLPPMQLVQDERTAGVELSLAGREIAVRLNRTGPVGGSAAVSQNGRTDRYQFRDAIVDSYDNWRSDPRYAKWMTEARFDFVIPREMSR